MAKRFFTLEQARAILPTVRSLVETILLISAKIEQAKTDVQPLADAAVQNSGIRAGTEHVQALLLLQKYLQEIEAQGCIVKSIEEGLIDFPHLREGREVYLCWKYPEADIEYWHEVDAGFAGRTRIETKDES